MRLFRNYALYVVCAIAATAIVTWLESGLVLKVLLPNLTGIVVGLLAINVQTTAVIAAKLRELSIGTEIKFAPSVSQFRLAFIEQAFLVLAALAVNALADAAGSPVRPIAISAGAFFVLFAALHIFLDTSIGLLIAIFPDT